jgi:hypothetical protein
MSVERTAVFTAGIPGRSMGLTPPPASGAAVMYFTRRIDWYGASAPAVAVQAGAKEAS